MIPMRSTTPNTVNNSVPPNAGRFLNTSSDMAKPKPQPKLVVRATQSAPGTASPALQASISKPRATAGASAGAPAGAPRALGPFVNNGVARSGYQPGPKVSPDTALRPSPTREAKNYDGRPLVRGDAERRSPVERVERIPGDPSRTVPGPLAPSDTALRPSPTREARTYDARSSGSVPRVPSPGITGNLELPPRLSPSGQRSPRTPNSSNDTVVRPQQSPTQFTPIGSSPTRTLPAGAGERRRSAGSTAISASLRPEGNPAPIPGIRVGGSPTSVQIRSGLTDSQQRPVSPGNTGLRPDVSSRHSPPTRSSNDVPSPSSAKASTPTSKSPRPAAPFKPTSPVSAKPQAINPQTAAAVEAMTKLRATQPQDNKSVGLTQPKPRPANLSAAPTPAAPVPTPGAPVSPLTTPAPPSPDSVPPPLTRTTPLPSALANPDKHKGEKQKKVLQISSNQPEEKKYEVEAVEFPEDDPDLIRKPSAFNFSENGTVYAACPRCGANYHRGANPCILQCNHTFCSDCMEGMAKGGKISCPRCYRPTELGEQGVAGLPRNYALISLAELDSEELQRRSTCMLIESLDASCPICMETYGETTVPLNLGCGHTACDQCIVMLAEKAGSEQIECPTCRETSDLNGVTANLDLKKTVETVKLLKEHARYRAEKKLRAQQ